MNKIINKHTLKMELWIFYLACQLTMSNEAAQGAISSVKHTAQEEVWRKVSSPSTSLSKNLSPLLKKTSRGYFYQYYSETFGMVFAFSPCCSHHYCLGLPTATTAAAPFPITWIWWGGSGENVKGGVGRWERKGQGARVGRCGARCQRGEWMGEWVTG